jgi:hypothetical protein
MRNLCSIKYYGSGIFGLEYCSIYGRNTFGYTDPTPLLEVYVLKFRAK